MSAFQEIINSDKPVLVDFFATWCGPCQALAPILKETAEEVQGLARVIKIDVDKNPKLAEKYGIRGVPTMMIFKNGVLKWRQSGVLPAAQITSAIKSFL